MPHRSETDRSPRILRFALYGPANAGKTCILAALAMPHTAAAGVSAVWRSSASDTPRPEGPEESWSADDPAVARYRGAAWLREAIRSLDAGSNPPPNPNREPFRFRFDFRHDGFDCPVELFDYSGELLDPDVSDDLLATRLRQHLRECDGLLVLAEVPRPDGSVGRADELNRIGRAFALLRDEGSVGLADSVAVALVVNKWDRRGDRVDAAALEDFLGGEDAEPHRRLRDALRTRNPENFRTFATSAFGRSGATESNDRPPTERPLPSYGLEEPFLWAARRALEQSADRVLSAVRSEAGAFRWWRILQPLTSRRSRLTEAVERLRRDYPDEYPHAAEARRILAATRPVARRQWAGLVFAVFLTWGIATGAFDLLRYVRYRPALDGPHAVALADLEAADRWLTGFRERHKLWSPFSWLILSPSGANRLATNVADRIETARRRADADQNFRGRLAAWSTALADARSLQDLANLRGDLPRGEPETISEELLQEFRRLRQELDRKYKSAKESAELSDDERHYYDEIADWRIDGAARILAKLVDRPEAAKTREILVRNFRIRTVEFFERQLSDCQSSQNSEGWQKAGDKLDAVICDDRVKALLATEDLRTIESTWQKFRTANDRRLYERVRNSNKPLEACREYLDEKWSTKSMTKFVNIYQTELAKLDGTLEVSIVLHRLDFGSDGWDSVKNRVKVYANHELKIDKDDVTSRKGESIHEVAEFPFSGKRGDKIELRVEIDCTSGNFLFRNRSQGSGTDEWTIDELNGKVREIDLGKYGNRAAFTLKGLPKVPDLPEYPK